MSNMAALVHILEGNLGLVFGVLFGGLGDFFFLCFLFLEGLGLDSRRAGGGDLDAAAVAAN